MSGQFPVDRRQQAWIIRNDIRREALHHATVARDEKFLEIPHYFTRRIWFDAIAREALAHGPFADAFRLSPCEHVIKRMLIAAGHADLAEQRKIHVVGR